MRNRKATTADFLIAGFLFLLVLAVVVPFINTIAISFSTQREYLNTPLLLIPRKPTLNNYINLLRDPIFQATPAPHKQLCETSIWESRWERSC